MAVIFAEIPRALMDCLKGRAKANHRSVPMELQMILEALLTKDSQPKKNPE